MKIGIDIDGVLNDVEEWHLAYGSKYCAIHNIKRDIHPDKYLIKDQFELTDEEEQVFWNEYVFDLVVAIPPRYFASEVIHKLREMGNKIIILSGRNGMKLPKECQHQNNFYVEEWLKKHNIEYDDILIDSTNKKQDCFDLGIDVMIEDKPSNVLAVSEDIPVLCFHTKYNRDLMGKNIIRVYSWYEIYSYLCPQSVPDVSMVEEEESLESNFIDAVDDLEVF